MLALVAPRLLCISSVRGSVESGPEGEFLAAKLASPAWGLYGMKGLAAESFPQAGKALQDGFISYRLREGGRDMRLSDWSGFMDFADRHGWRKMEVVR
jgi:hypothetical protein